MVRPHVGNQLYRLNRMTGQPFDAIILPPGTDVGGLCGYDLAVPNDLLHAYRANASKPSNLALEESYQTAIRNMKECDYKEYLELVEPTGKGSVSGDQGWIRDMEKPRRRHHSSME